MRYRKTLILGFLSSLLLGACGDGFRYPCQNPAKANTPECSCTNPDAPRTKNKALGAIETGATTTTIHLLVGFDC